MTVLLEAGRPIAILQNIVYALPPFKCSIYTDATTPTIQQSNTVDFTANTSVTLTAGTAELTAPFLRCTSGNITIELKRV